MNIPKIQCMQSANGNDVPNQFIITDGEVSYFQSYDSVIARINHTHGRAVQLDEKCWNYSVTTGKYRNQFLNETKKETEKKIKSGEYILTDLN